MRKLAIGAALALAALAACPKDDLGSVNDPPPVPPKIEPGMVLTFKPAVPLGQTVPCANLVDAVKLSASLGQTVVVEDKTAQVDKQATAICQLKLAGTPPSEAAQKRMYAKRAQILGILPGDEYCQIGAYCSFVNDAKEAKERCQNEGQEIASGEEAFGDLTCIRTVQAGAVDRFVFTVLDPETRCRFVVQPGPGATDRNISRACTKAALDTIGPEHLKW